MSYKTVVTAFSVKLAMKKFVIFILYLIVSVIQFIGGQVKHLKASEEHHNMYWTGISPAKHPHAHNFIRKKSEPSFQTIPTPTKATVEPVKPYDPCAPYNPPVPDFRAPGRRISEMRGREMSKNLLAAEIDIIDSKKCDNLLKKFYNRKWNGLLDSQICAGKIIGALDTCQGDSGGPLSVRINLPIDTTQNAYCIGVTSFGVGCGTPGLPGVYTRVSCFIDWIKKIVWPGL